MSNIFNPGAGGGGGGLSAVGFSAGTTNTLATGVSFINSNGVTFGIVGNTITASVGAAGGGLTNINISAGTTSNNLSNLIFANLNGVSFGLNGSTVTASHNGLTTARASTDAIGLNTALTAGPLAWTVNSSGLSLNAGSAAGTTSGFAGNLISGSMTHNTAGLNISLNHPAWLTTARASTDAIGLNTAQTNVTWTINSSGLSLNAAGYAGTGFTTTTAAGAVIAGTHATNGLLLAVPAYLTTARASTDAVGLNTAQSNVTWTVNSNGLSLDARGYAGTGTTFAGTNVSASVTLNSNGLNLALSAAAGGGGGGTITAFATSNTTQSSSGTIPANSLIFAGAGIASVGVSNGSIIVSVPSGGGAGDGGVFAGVSNLGNTAGSTGTVSTGNFVLVGSNLTLSQSTGAAGSAATVTIIGQASSSLVAVAPIYLSTNGSTVSISAQPMNLYAPFPLYNNTSFSSFGQNTLYMQFFIPNDAISMSAIEFYARGSFVSSTNNQAYSQTISYGLYSQETGTNSTRMGLIASSSIGLTVAYSSNTSYAYTIGQGATAFNSASGGTVLASNISGPFHWYMPFSTNIAKDVKHALAIHISSTTAGNTGPMRFAPLVMTVQNSLSYAKVSPTTVLAPNATNYGDFDMAVGTVTTNAMPSAIAFNAMSVAVSRQKLFFNLEGA